MEEQKINFELSSKQIKYKDILNKQFLELEVYAISDVNPNRNNTHFTLESMQKALPNIKNKPILGFFEKGDFVEHNGKVGYDFDLKKEYWDTENGERILGLIRESDPIEIVEENGLHWIKLRCALWVSYCYKQVRRLLKDKNKKVSVEITVHKKEIREDGVEEILEFTLNGITILGSKNGRQIMEGIQGAHLSVLEELNEEVYAEQKKVLTFAYAQMDADSSVCEQVKDTNATKEVKEVQMENIQSEEQINENFVEDLIIEVDKSKESMSNEDWGSVDKTALRNKVIEASNFESVADEIFLDLREGWKDKEVSKLKYPVMQLKGNKAVYNREALAVAKAYAEKNNEEEVLAKLKKIYENLDLTDEKSYSVEAYSEDYEDEHGEEMPPVEEIAAPLEEAKDNCDEEVSTEEVPANAAESCEQELIEEVIVAEESEEEEKVSKEEYERVCKKLEESLIRCKEQADELEKIKMKNESLEEKMLDYNEIKLRMEIAENKIYKRFCDDLEMKACEMMSNENIKEEDVLKIKEKCQKGEYSCEDDIKKDVAYAIYSNRPMHSERYSAPIEVPNLSENKGKTIMTREQRIAARCNK